MNIVRHLLFGPIEPYNQPVTEAERFAQRVLSDYTNYEFYNEDQIVALEEAIELLENSDDEFSIEIDPNQNERLLFRDGSVLWLIYEGGLGDPDRWQFGVHSDWGQYSEGLFGPSPVGMYDLHHQPDYALVRSPDDRYMYKRARNRMNQLERSITEGKVTSLKDSEWLLCRVMLDHLEAEDRLDEGWNPRLQEMLRAEEAEAEDQEEKEDSPHADVT